MKQFFRVLPVVPKSSDNNSLSIDFVQNTIVCHDNGSCFSEIGLFTHFRLKFEHFNSVIYQAIKLL